MVRTLRVVSDHAGFAPSNGPRCVEPERPIFGHISQYTIGKNPEWSAVWSIAIKLRLATFVVMLSNSTVILSFFFIPSVESTIGFWWGTRFVSNTDLGFGLLLSDAVMQSGVWCLRNGWDSANNEGCTKRFRFYIPDDTGLQKKQWLECHIQIGLQIRCMLEEIIKLL